MKRTYLPFGIAMAALGLGLLVLDGSKYAGEHRPNLDRAELQRENQEVEQRAEQLFSDGVQEEVSHIEGIRRVCGEVCDTSVEGKGPLNQAGFSLVRKNIDCKQLFHNFHVHDRGISRLFPQPPREIPQMLSHYYTYNGRIKIGSRYIKEKSKFSHLTRIWTKESIEHNVAILKGGGFSLKGSSYGWDDNKRIVTAVKEALPLDGKRVLVIGSISPWLESIALAHGAREVVTLEYSKINSLHPQVRAFIPTEFASAYINGTLGAFDAMMTYSSLEHSGLGRYGDGLHPWGDLVAMARTWCVLKEDAMVLVGVPSSKLDVIAYNAHKCYGPLLLSHLLANFELTYISHPNLEGLSNPSCVPAVHVVAIAKKVN